MDNQGQKQKKKFYKRWWFWLIVIFVIGIIASSGKDNSQQSVSQTNAPAVSPQKAVEDAQAKAQDKADAEKELKDIMALGVKAQLVKSYEFSDTAEVVYADSTWYSQTVQFKKDFIAKIAMLKERITGYRHFEVRDAYSNEKLAEVTAFSGSLEIYK